MQWQSFDENFDQLTHWVHDMESQVLSDPDLKATLQEKKAQLQNLKVSFFICYITKNPRVQGFRAVPYPITTICIGMHILYNLTN